MPNVRQSNRMRLSLRTLFVLTLLLAVATTCFLALLNSNSRSWASGTSRGSAVDNPGYVILAAETDQLLAKEGFVPCDRPKSMSDSGSLHGKFFRSKKYDGLYAFTYADKRYYAANVFVTVRGSMKEVPTLERYTEKLVADFRNLWDDERHSLENWPDYDAE